MKHREIVELRTEISAAIRTLRFMDKFMAKLEERRPRRSPATQRGVPKGLTLRALVQAVEPYTEARPDLTVDEALRLWPISAAQAVRETND